MQLSPSFPRASVFSRELEFYLAHGAMDYKDVSSELESVMPEDSVYREWLPIRVSITYDLQTI